MRSRSADESAPALLNCSMANDCTSGKGLFNSFFQEETLFCNSRPSTSTLPGTGAKRNVGSPMTWDSRRLEKRTTSPTQPPWAVSPMKRSYHLSCKALTVLAMTATVEPGWKMYSFAMQSSWWKEPQKQASITTTGTLGR